MGHVGKTVPVRLFRRPDLVERIDELTAQLTAAEHADEWDNTVLAAPAVRADLEQVVAEAQEAWETYEFRALDSLAWSDLLAKHPPRREDRVGSLDYNAETFPHAAIAACRVDREMTEPDARQLAGDVSMGQWRMVWQAVLVANLGPGDLPKSPNGSANRSSGPRVSEPKPTTASPSASPGPSS